MNTRPWKILVVDDYPDAVDLMGDLLRLEGYEVATAHHGLQGLEVARAFRPDLVLLDINMPVMDGLSAARALRAEQAPGTRLILIAQTAHSLPSDVQAALDAGFDRHVRKPVPADALLDLIEAYLPRAGASASAAASTPPATTGGEREMPRRPDDLFGEPN
jgi:CheY-like chemotaxis protein